MTCRGIGMAPNTHAGRQSSSLLESVRIRTPAKSMSTRRIEGARPCASTKPKPPWDRSGGLAIHG